MPINTQQLRHHLQGFDYKALFIEELSWNSARGVSIPPIDLDGVMYTFIPTAQAGDMVVTECQASDGNIPDDGRRKKVDAHVTKIAFEHIIIFTDKSRTISRWRWVKHEKGKPDKAREHIYRQGQPGDLLMQKLVGIAFDLDELDEEGKVSIAMVTSRVARAFDVEKVTKKFYEQFQKEHNAFLEFLKGVQDIQGRDWYASVMLNRLMFLYFVQKKGFLNSDPDYLQTKLAESQGNGRDRFYRDFLLILFFDGLASEESERNANVQRLLGDIPYLNGGIFLPHQIEEANDNIQIADKAFENLFKFFDAWTWHLDDRPLHDDGEINPDVLGYIFEKYINQKQMGAYYSKEDITDYICKNTVLPFLLDKIDLNVAQEIGSIDLYIYDAVSTDEYLPTETEREYTARRQHYEQIMADFAAGKISTVNDLITYNLDIRAFVEDWLRRLDAPIMLRRFYKALTELTILDPTCGSGAFLFAAMNILEPLYEGCLTKMEQFLANPKIAHQYRDFKTELERVDQHPNRSYFVFKSIIINNLYGVDIMDEAIEICKLRLFLKLVAQVDDVRRVEPLPDIDFNIQAGNTLVGFATKDEIAGRMFAAYLLPKVEEVDRALANFRDMQTRIGVKAKLFKEAKERINATLGEIRVELHQALMEDYKHNDLNRFCESHKPFHWYVEFNSVMANGGFDVIVGNPPYVESNKVEDYSIRDYRSEASNNLYAFTVERAAHLLRVNGRFGVIVPVGAFSVRETSTLRALLKEFYGTAWLSGYAIRPAKLFEGVDQRLAIYISIKQQNATIRAFASRYHHWYSDERTTLFDRLGYEDVSKHELNGVYPKVGNRIALDIISKVLKQIKPASLYMLKSGGGVMLHYHRSPRYWIRAMDFEQYFKSPTRTKSIHHFRDLHVINLDMTKFIGAVLNSSLFFFWFITVGNGRNLTGEDVKNFPIGTPTPTIVKQMGEIFDRLMEDYKKNSIIRVRKDQEYQEFNTSASKPIIDEIDYLLAQHYGFTDEEVDFIINYDIKYRMGKDADEAGEEE